MKLSVALIIATAMMMMIIPSVHATGGPAPTLSTDQADCFRNVVSDGDIFCLIRYDLPTFVTATPPPVSAEAWCAELVDQDGCTADPVEPTNETSQITDSAFVTLYQNCGVDCSTGTLESQVRTPRINFALGGAYLAPGHAVTFGDPTVNGCVQSSTTLFTVASISCIPTIATAANPAPPITMSPVIPCNLKNAMIPSIRKNSVAIAPPEIPNKIVPRFVNAVGRSVPDAVASKDDCNASGVPLGVAKSSSCDDSMAAWNLSGMI